MIFSKIYSRCPEAGTCHSLLERQSGPHNDFLFSGFFSYQIVGNSKVKTNILLRLQKSVKKIYSVIEPP
jgi:hypothetical protein